MYVEPHHGRQRSWRLAVAFWPKVETEQGDGDRPKRSHHMSPMGVADAAAVFVKAKVTRIVQAVLDSPVTSYEVAEALFIGFGGQQDW